MRKFKVVTLGGLVLALLSSAALNYVLYGYAQKYYRELNETRLNPLGLSYYEAENNAAADNVLVVFGDSRAHEWHPQLNNVTVYNRGIGSQTSTQVLGRFEAHVAPLAPDVVLIEVGINDLKAIPLFPQRRAEIIGNLQQNIVSLAEQSNALGAHAVISTIFPLGQLPLERRVVWSPDVAVAIDEVNAFIAQLEGEGVSVFSAEKTLTSPTSNTVEPAYSLNFLHINEAGYAALNAQLYPLLETVLPTR